MMKRDYEAIGESLQILAYFAIVGVATIVGVIGFGIYKAIHAVVKSLGNKQHSQTNTASPNIVMPGLDDVY
jgi:hypothetical protein